MKTIIAGSRSITCPFVVAKCVEQSGFLITEVVCGGARGVDRLGYEWAARNGIRVKSIIPDWDGRGRGAGLARNQDMADYADALIAIWDGESRGTKDMIDRANKKGLKIYIYQTNLLPLWGADLD